MAELTTKQRNALPDSKFALPGRRYPIPDAAHARDAKARASQMLKAGKLTAAEKARIDAAADRVLSRSRDDDD